MTMSSPTAAFEHDGDLAVLSTGDVRIAVHPEMAAPVPRRADQPYRPPAGDEGLRALICTYSTTPDGPGPEPGQVVVTPGARQAIFAALRVVLGERREVLLPTPYWSSYPHLIEMAGGTPVLVPGTVGSGTVDLRVLDAFRTQATAAIVVNSPRNPDGAVMPSDTLRKVIAWAERHGIYVLFDQVYRGVLLHHDPSPTVFDLYPELPQHCVLVDGLTKSHALAGLRMGWAIAAPELAASITATASHLIGGTCGLAQEASVRTLSMGAEIQRRIGAELSVNLDAALDQLTGTPGLECARPDAGIFLFPDLRGWLATEAPNEAHKNLAGWLRGDHRVVVVDGDAFGAPGYVRISYALPAGQLREGVARLRRAIEGTRGD